MSWQTRGLTVERAGRRILDDVTIDVAPGSFTAVLGPNGAGKSTLVHALAGVEKADDGTVAWDGTALTEMTGRRRARTLALVEQQVGSEVDLRVADVVMLGRTPHVSRLAGPSGEDRAVVSRALAAVGASGLADRDFLSLSGGERQRVLVAKALAQEPQGLLLDEPTNHLDVHAALEFLRLLRRLVDDGLTVVAVVHDLGLALDWVDAAVVLDRGRLVAAGPTSEVITPDVVEQVWHVRPELVPHGSRLLLTFPAR